MNYLNDRDLSRLYRTTRISPKDVRRGDLLVDDFGTHLVASATPCIQTQPDGTEVDAVMILDPYDSGGPNPVAFMVDIVSRDSIRQAQVQDLLEYQEAEMGRNHP